mmetsp:Transcript_48414/g.122225  ORF Transcript_48414/g.122225 Transcript_48414/m.122225 type:complete len:221 (-) Transcript_48414:178-840(-)
MIAGAAVLLMRSETRLQNQGGYRAASGGSCGGVPRALQLSKAAREVGKSGGGKAAQPAGRLGLNGAQQLGRRVARCRIRAHQRGHLAVGQRGGAHKGGRMGAQGVEGSGEGVPPAVSRLAKRPHNVHDVHPIEAAAVSWMAGEHRLRRPEDARQSTGLPRGGDGPQQRGQLAGRAAIQARRGPGRERGEQRRQLRRLRSAQEAPRAAGPAQLGDVLGGDG